LKSPLAFGLGLVGGRPLERGDELVDKALGRRARSELSPCALRDRVDEASTRALV